MIRNIGLSEDICICLFPLIYISLAMISDIVMLLMLDCLCVSDSKRWIIGLCSLLLHFVLICFLGKEIIFKEKKIIESIER